MYSNKRTSVTYEIEFSSFFLFYWLLMKKKWSVDQS